MTEQELITALQNQEPKAQRYLYERFGNRLLTLCLRYVKDQAEAEDVLINGFMKIFNSVANFESKGSFEGWMKRIMVNEALMQIRKKEPVHMSIDSEYDIFEADHRTDHDLDAQELMDLLNELPSGYRTVFNLYAIEGYNHKEIGELLGISEGASKSQLSKARAALQKKINQLTPALA